MLIVAGKRGHKMGAIIGKVCLVLPSCAAPFEVSLR